MAHLHAQVSILVENLPARKRLFCMTQEVQQELEALFSQRDRAFGVRQAPSEYIQAKLIEDIQVCVDPRSSFVSPPAMQRVSRKNRLRVLKRFLCDS